MQQRVCSRGLSARSRRAVLVALNLQVPILGVAVNKVPARDLAITTSQLKKR